jgi:hypothetical protein
MKLIAICAVDKSRSEIVKQIETGRFFFPREAFSIVVENAISDRDLNLNIDHPVTESIADKP